MTNPSTATGRTLPTGTWRLDPEQTTVTVTAKKFHFLSVPATLTVASSRIDIDNDGHVANVEVTLDASSYTSSNPKRDAHVLGEDFLDAEHHQELTFRANQVTPHTDRYQAAGSVTVTGQSHPLTIDIRELEFDATTGSFLATSTVDRNAVGLGKLPSLIVGRTVQLTVAATALIAAP